jgi:hypothetical protein
MSRDVTELLNRRSDLSTFVVHLTKATPDRSAHDNLVSILGSKTIEARTAMGWKGRLPTTQTESMRVACFSETPLEHVYSLFQDIAGRAVHLTPYGLAFTRAVARQNGVNPVWYVSMLAGQRDRWEIATALDALRDAAAAAPGGLRASPAGKILPFCEQMGTWSPTNKKEFSWEREWRHLGDFHFNSSDVALVFCPEIDITEFEATGEYRAVDPSWSLEGMVDHLRRRPVAPTKSLGVPTPAARAAQPARRPPIIVVGQRPSSGH